MESAFLLLIINRGVNGSICSGLKGAHQSFWNRIPQESDRKVSDLRLSRRETKMVRGREGQMEGEKAPDSKVQGKMREVDGGGCKEGNGTIQRVYREKVWCSKDAGTDTKGNKGMRRDEGGIDSFRQLGGNSSQLCFLKLEPRERWKNGVKDGERAGRKLLHSLYHNVQ